MSAQMMMNVLGIKLWEMVDEKTGEVRKGCTVYVGQEPENSNAEIIGWEIMKFSAPFSFYQDIKKSGKKFPSECSVDVALRLGAGGKGSLQILAIEEG